MKYCKILHLGDPAVETIFDSNYYITEKYDGSQFRAWCGEDKIMYFGSKAVDYDESHLLKHKLFSFILIE